MRSGSAVAPARHRSLHSLIDWSYDLCSAEERTLWARLGVFPGSFDLEAVEQVCAGDDVPRELVLDLLSGLVDKSILLTEPGRRPGALPDAGDDPGIRPGAARSGRAGD